MIDSITLDNLNLKAFDGTPFDGVPSEVFCSKVVFRKGMSYLIEASSGRGKSSFCSFLCGLRNDYTGTIMFGDIKACDGAGVDFADLRKSSIAFMFQDCRLFPELTAVENVMLKSQLTGFVGKEEVRDMLARLGLSAHIDKPCATLSLGQQQRVAFVRALAQPCDFILLDEPISHLDDLNATIVAQMLRERQQKDGIGVIVTSVGYRLPYEYDKVLKM